MNRNSLLFPILSKISYIIDLKTESDLSSSRRFIQDIIRYAPSKFLPAAMSLLWSYVFTRVFLPEEYGIYGLCISIVGPLVTIFTEWAAQPIGRFYAEYSERKLMNVYHAVLKYLARIVLVIISLVVISAIVYFFFEARKYLFLVSTSALLLFSNCLTNLIIPILPASLDSKAYNVISIFRPLLRVVFAFSLVYCFGRNISFLLLAEALSFLILLLPLVSIVNDKLAVNANAGITVSRCVVYENIGKFLKYGMPMMAWFFASQLLSVGDRFVIQWFRGSGEVGIYTANYSLISGIAGLLSSPITLAAFPLIMKLWAMGKKEEVAQTIKKMTYIYGIISICFLGCAAVSSKPLIDVLLGSNFKEGYVIVLPVVLGVILWNASILGHKGMELYNKTYIMVIYAFIAALVNLCLNVIFIPKYGYVAAAWTTFASYLVYTALIYLSSGKFIKWSIPFKALTPYMLCSFMAIYVCKQINLSSSMATLIVRMVIFFAIYLIGCIGILLFKHSSKANAN